MAFGMFYSPLALLAKWHPYGTEGGWDKLTGFIAGEYKKMVENGGTSKT